MSLWNPDTDPLPPVQPKEVGFLITSTANYRFLPSMVQQAYAQVVGSQFYSYSRQKITGNSGGVNEGKPIFTFNYDDYENPDDPDATLYLQYQKGPLCSYTATEGYSPYPGYDFYTNMLLQYYADNITIYYNLTDYEDLGLCKVYTVLSPWPYQPPRELTYTLAYENSTGYLVAYDINGTEYCCVNNGGCVTDGYECGDGSSAILTWAISQNHYSNYQIYNASSYPEGFFGAYCPLENTSSSSTLGAAVIASICLACLVLGCGLGYFLSTFTKSKLPMSKTEETNEI